MYGLNNASKTPIAAITLLVREKAFSQRLLIETKIKSWPVLNFNTTFATKSARSGHCYARTLCTLRHHSEEEADILASNLVAKLLKPSRCLKYD